MSPRSYDQYCPVAKALDVIGDRWALLILRDLALGPKRFSDLAGRLEGIAPNLLTRRLRELESNDVITRRRLPPPAASQVYELTDSGRALEPALMELARWGTRFLGPVADGETFCIDWLIPVLQEFADEDAARGVHAMYEFRIEGSAFHVAVDDGEVAVRPGPSPAPPDLMVESDFATFAAVGFGAMHPQEALAGGRARFEGDPRALEKSLDILAPVRFFAKVVA